VLPKALSQGSVGDLEAMHSHLVQAGHAMAEKRYVLRVLGSIAVYRDLPDLGLNANDFPDDVVVVAGLDDVGAIHVVDLAVGVLVAVGAEEELGQIADENGLL
jgi:hypothetical protein